ncbi:hypothetical protein AGMMS50212_15410 [Spirochaetia bacterium]|nr:hypothetical protein AGMMS50212_15410 [Spirochaetia bacterium]
MSLDDVIESTTETVQQTFKSAPSFAPLDPFKDFWTRACPVNLSHPEMSELKKEYTFVGILTSLKPHEITKEGKNKGKLMGFGSLADYNGQIDITFYHDQWKKYSETLQQDIVIVFKGTLEEYNGKRGIIFKELLDTTKLDDMAWKEVHIRLQPDAVKSENDLVPLRDCILNHSGNCYVFIHVPVVGNEAVIRTTTHLSAAAGTAHIDAIKKCLAVAEVWRV